MFKSFSTIAILLLLISGCKTKLEKEMMMITNDNYCKCKYLQENGLSIKDSLGSTFTAQHVYQLGAGVSGFCIKKCNRTRNTISVDGGAPYEAYTSLELEHHGEPGFLVLKCKKDSEGHFSITDTLAVSDANGEFSFKSVVDTNTYLIVYQEKYMYSEVYRVVLKPIKKP